MCLRETWPTSDNYIFKTNNSKNLKFSEILSLNLLYKKASMNNMQEKSSFEDIIVGSWNHHLNNIQWKKRQRSDLPHGTETRLVAKPVDKTSIFFCFLSNYHRLIIIYITICWPCHNLVKNQTQDQCFPLNVNLSGRCLDFVH